MSEHPKFSCPTNKNVFNRLQMTTTCIQGAVVPVRLKQNDAKFLSDTAGKTGFKQAELIRRAIWLLRAEAKRANSYNFLLELASDA